MINISKQEKEDLVKAGIKFGENGISHTWTKHRKYYLAETAKNIKALNKIRDARRVG